MVIQFLLEQELTAHLVNDEGETPITLAAKLQYYEILEILIKSIQTPYLHSPTSPLVLSAGSSAPCSSSSSSSSSSSAVTETSIEEGASTFRDRGLSLVSEDDDRSYRPSSSMKSSIFHPTAEGEVKNEEYTIDENDDNLLHYHENLTIIAPPPSLESLKRKVVESSHLFLSHDHFSPKNKILYRAIVVSEEVDIEPEELKLDDPDGYIRYPLLDSSQQSMISSEAAQPPVGQEENAVVNTLTVSTPSSLVSPLAHHLPCFLKDNTHESEKLSVLIPTDQDSISLLTMTEMGGQVDNNNKENHPTSAITTMKTLVPRRIRKVASRVVRFMLPPRDT
jgi:hypothetical protein